MNTEKAEAIHGEINKIFEREGITAAEILGVLEAIRLDVYLTLRGHSEEQCSKQVNAK